MAEAFIVGAGFAVLLAAAYLGVWYVRRWLRERDALARDRRLMEEERRRSMEEGQAFLARMEEEGKAALQQARERMLEDIRQRRDKLFAKEKALARREKDLRLRAQFVAQKEAALQNQEETLSARQDALGAREAAQGAKSEKLRARLEQAAGLGAKQAHQELLRHMERDARRTLDEVLERWGSEVRAEARSRAREIIASALAQEAPEAAVYHATLTLPLPNEEMKARIVGRDGRNVRTFERLTGVEVFVNDLPHAPPTPGPAVMLSCYHPRRRAVAQRAMERLIESSRIYPTSIEEAVEEARRAVEEGVEEDGKVFAERLGVDDVPSEALRLLGELRFYLEHGCDLASHTWDVTRLASRMATELGADASFARRVALLHDIGKVSGERTLRGTAAERAVEVLRRCGEPERIQRAVANVLDRDAPLLGVEEAVVRTAHGLVEGRPGATDDALQKCFERMQAMEAAAREVAGKGVEAFAFRTGHEIHLFVAPKRLSDAHLPVLANTVARTLGEQFPDFRPIRVSAFREVRAASAAL
ncbi:MAG: DUF3552 domain-containing protein [Acidobacteriota bacterium]|nr:MAG: DUF3552 domain-containing protein [Acidobacteriota bacterium]